MNAVSSNMRVPCLPFENSPVSFLLCALAVISPFLFFPTDTGFHNRQRIAQVVILAVIPIFALRRVACDKHGLRPSRNALVFSLFAFFAIGLISSFSSYSPRFALYEWASFVLLFVGAWLIASELQASRGLLLNRILTLCGYGCALYVFGVLVVYLGVWISRIQPYVNFFIFGFDNIRFFNHAQTVSLPILVLLTIRSAGLGKQYWAWFTLTVLWWALLFLSAGRGTFMGVAAGVALTFIFRRRFALPWCRLMILSCMAGAISYFVFFEILLSLNGLEVFNTQSDVVARTLSNPTSGRMSLWERAWEMSNQSPWLGRGPMHFAHYGREIDAGAHPHNWVLQIASEWGLLALIALGVAICIACQKLLGAAQWIEPNDTVNQATLCAWLTTSMAILIDGLVSGVIVMPVSQVWIVLFLGSAWGWVRTRIPVSVAPSSINLNAIKQPTFKLSAAAALLIISVAFLLYGVFPEVLDLSRIYNEALDSPLYPSHELRPRLWITGFF